MKRTICVLLTYFCAVFSGCAAEPMTGAYSKASIVDQEVKAAAKFAVEARSKSIEKPNAPRQTKLKLLKIIGAEEQVVAGKNYRLKLKVQENGAQKTVVATVWWQPWRKPDPYQLTAWK